jgi:hypothetical protein
LHGPTRILLVLLMYGQFLVHLDFAPCCSEGLMALASNADFGRNIAL